MGRTFEFKKNFSYETRVEESAKMRHKYPDRVPVIVEKAGRTDLLDLEKKKYLVPEDLTVGEFVYVIRRRLQLSPGQALFFFVNDVLPPNASLMSSVYKDHKDEDGFLYINYSGEKTFGSTDLPGVRPS